MDLRVTPFLTINNMESIGRITNKHSIGIAVNSNIAPTIAME